MLHRLSTLHVVAIFPCVIILLLTSTVSTFFNFLFLYFYIHMPVLAKAHTSVCFFFQHLAVSHSFIHSFLRSFTHSFSHLFCIIFWLQSVFLKLLSLILLFVFSQPVQHYPLPKTPYSTLFICLGDFPIEMNVMKDVDIPLYLCAVDASKYCMCINVACFNTNSKKQQRQQQQQQQQHNYTVTTSTILLCKDVPVFLFLCNFVAVVVVPLT